MPVANFRRPVRGGVDMGVTRTTGSARPCRASLHPWQQSGTPSECEYGAVLVTSAMRVLHIVLAGAPTMERNALRHARSLSFSIHNRRRTEGRGERAVRSFAARMLRGRL